MDKSSDLYWLSENELSEVLDIIKSGNIVQGKEVEEFEKEFAKFIGVSHAIAVNTGTAGLHVALQVLNKERMGNVITTPLSFVSTANSILYGGSVPVFSDIEYGSMNIDPIQVKNNLNSKTHGVLGVHLYGLPFKIKEILDICKKNGTFLIEDCAQALGSKYGGKQVGIFGDAGIFSFYDTKHLKLGEGGMIVTNKKDVMEKCRMIRSHGASKQYVHEFLGYNFRLNEVFAKIGRIQLKKINGMLDARRKKAQIYFENLSDIDALQLPPIQPNVVHSFYKFPVIMKKKISKRKNLLSMIKQKTGIQLLTGYPCPIYKQPLYREITKRLWLSQHVKFPKYSTLKCTNTESIVKSIIELPTDPWIPEDEILQISKAFKDSFNEI